MEKCEWCPVDGHCRLAGSRRSCQKVRDGDVRFLALARGEVPSQVPLPRLVASAVQAAATFVAAGCPLADEETVAARLAACAGCDARKDGRCTACGCVLAAKARLSTEECPLGRWP